MDKLIYYTDGGCEPNPGKGTWAFVCTNTSEEQAGHCPETTNNRMEMTAVLKAIEHALSIQYAFKDHSILIVSDSQYVCNGFNLWMHSWAKKRWMKKGEVIKNKDIWEQLYKYKDVASLSWVRGHNGNEFNELVDSILRDEYNKVFGGSMTY